ncbi:MAG: hypothetical protein ACPGQL_00120 [Thermoplasmatota archaeon]
MRWLPVLLLANTAWLAFFLAGASTRYFLDTPWWFRLFVVDLLPMAALAWAGPGLTRQVDRAGGWRPALVVAAAFSLPYLVYDAILFRGYLGEGWDYLRVWWHLPLFSALPWLAVPYWAVASRPSTQPA